MMFYSLIYGYQVIQCHIINTQVLGKSKLRLKIYALQIFTYISQILNRNLKFIFIFIEHGSISVLKVLKKVEQYIFTSKT